MNSALLLVPLLILLASSAVAALFGLPRLNGRLSLTRLSWLLALAPLSAFVLLLILAPKTPADPPLVWSFEWLPAFGLRLGFYYDSLSALFALLVTGIGTLVIIYTGYYFKGDQTAWRFLAYLLLFMASMLGLVMAGDVISLFIFWEGTSITSFLLVAYKTKDEAARKGAFQALFLTGGGGIALLAGLLMVAYVSGSTSFVEILNSGDALRSSAIYPVMLLLVAFGAFTKSAQFPAHIWLPRHDRANPGQRLPALRHYGQGRHLPDGAYEPGAGVHRFAVLPADRRRRDDDDRRRVSRPEAERPEVVAGLLHHQPAWRDDGDDRPGYQHRLQVAGDRRAGHALYTTACCSWLAGIVDHETGTRDLRRLAGCARRCRSPS